MAKAGNRNILLSRPKFLKQRYYWTKKLFGQLNNTDLFLDSENNGRKPKQRQPDRMMMALPHQLSRRLVNLGKGSDLSIYILLLSALKSLLYRYTFNQDIIVLSPVYKLKVTQDTINSRLFIRNRLDDTLTFKELVMEVKESVLQAYENQDYPFDKLLEYLFPSSPG